MSNKYINKCVGIACLTLVLSGCGVPALVEKTANSSVPESFVGSQDTTNTAQMKWKEFFTDPYLVSLIDTALNNNQGLR